MCLLKNARMLIVLGCTLALLLQHVSHAHRCMFVQGQMAYMPSCALPMQRLLFAQAQVNCWGQGQGYKGRWAAGLL